MLNGCVWKYRQAVNTQEVASALGGGKRVSQSTSEHTSQTTHACAGSFRNIPHTLVPVVHLQNEQSKQDGGRSGRHEHSTGHRPLTSNASHVIYSTKQKKKKKLYRIYTDVPLAIQWRSKAHRETENGEKNETFCDKATTRKRNKAVRASRKSDVFTRSVWSAESVNALIGVAVEPVFLIADPIADLCTHTHTERHTTQPVQILPHDDNPLE